MLEFTQKEKVLIYLILQDEYAKFHGLYILLGGEYHKEQAENIKKVLDKIFPTLA